MRICFIITYVILSVVPTAFAASELSDTTRLREVEVVATAPHVEVIPAQQLQGEELQLLNSNSVADALRYFSGVQVKDYGGVGGIKTVNVRSMGSHHTGVVYDGVALGNAQNGQIDLGQFSLDNIESVSLYNGQKSDILQPARDFGSAGSIYMRTRVPHFNNGKRFNLRAKVRTGSFGLINPSVLGEVKLSDKVNASMSAEWTCANGRYKFRYRKLNASGATLYDTTAVRRNGDINALRTELNLNGTLRGGEWHAKAYNYVSERGVPGAIVNNVWRRGERVGDNNSFAQASYLQTFGRFSTLNNVKYAFYRTHYVNNDSRQIRIDNLYRQHEVYLSSANEFAIKPWWRVALSYDLQWNTMWSDMPGFICPERISQMVSGATSIDLGRFKAQVSALGTFVHDRARKGYRQMSDKAVCTPGAFVSYDVYGGLSARAFFKQSFRMPTFNDLYYADMGNAKLNPERVTQYNLGLLYERSSGGLPAHMRFSVDAYYNYVTDKIVAYPRGTQFRWTMLNLGKVDIRGVDLTALLTLRPAKELELTLKGQYTWQRAIDITSADDSFYRHQIPYTPRHSASAVLNAAWRRWTLNYSYIYVSERYSQQENISYNYVAPWYTHDLSLSRDFTFGRVDMRVLLEVNNLLNRDYDVIVNYPMPKRNFRLTVTVEL